MKRLWIVLLAVVALAAWTLPAMADVTMGGQYRLRMEYRDDTTWTEDDGKDSATAYNQRVRLWATANPTDDTSVKVTLQDTREWGNGPRGNGGPLLTDDTVSCGAGSQTFDETVDGIDMNGDGDSLDVFTLTDTRNCSSVDVHEAYVTIANFFNTPLTLKIGRQELNYGDQRLIGAFGWDSRSRSFDALKLTHSTDAFSFDFVASKISEASSVFAGAGAAGNYNDQDLFILHGTIKSIPNNTLDVYLFTLRAGSGAGQIVTNNTGAIAGIDETQVLHNLGVRLKGKAGPIDYTAEVDMQSGELNTAGTDYDIDAMGYALRAGFTVPNNDLGLRIGLEYLFASGDDNAADSDIETFSNFFPTNHAHMGYADVIGWRNMNGLNVNVKLKPRDNLMVKVDYWMLELEEENDGFYGAGNWMNGAGACALCGTDVADEIDITLKYKYNDAVGIMAGLSFISPGDRIEDALGVQDSEDQIWSYLQLAVKF